MKILHAIDKSYIGGGQACVRILLEGQAEAGHETVLTCRAGGPLVDDARALGTVVYTAPYDKRFRPGPARVLARAAREEAVDVIHAHGLVAATYALLARRFFGARVPVVYHQHGFHHHNYGRLTRPARRWAERKVCGFVDAVVPVSDDDARSLEKGGYAPPGRIRRIHYGIPDAARRRDQVEAARGRLDLPAEAPVVGIVGRLHPQKAVDVFLRAAARVAEEDPAPVFVVVGTGELEDRLRTLGGELALDGRLRWLGGVPASDYIGLMDVATVTSRWEGLPFVLLEYMAWGRAIVTSDVPGCVEAVDDVAQIVPVGDHEATASAILRLLSEPRLAESHRRQARARYERAFTVPVMVENFDSLYEQVLR